MQGTEALRRLHQSTCLPRPDSGLAHRTPGCSNPVSSGRLVLLTHWSVNLEPSRVNEDPPLQCSLWEGVTLIWGIPSKCLSQLIYFLGSLRDRGLQVACLPHVPV